MKLNLLAKIIVTISSLLFIGVLFLTISLINSYNNEISNISKKSLIFAETSFNSVLNYETTKLSIALSFLMNNNENKQLFIDKQIDSLYKYSKPIFEEIKKNIVLLTPTI